MIIWAALAIVLLGAAALFGLRRAMFWIMVLRPACDRLFETIRSAAGLENGPGASLNFMMLGLSAFAIAHRPQALLAPAVLGWFGFVAAAAVSTALSPDPARALRLLLTLATYGAVLIAAHALVTDRRSAGVALASIILSSILPALLALVELAANPVILVSDERLFSSFMHPNIFAFYLVTVIATILFVLATSMFEISQGRRFLLLAWAGFLLFLLLATKTRSAWIALALIFAVQALLVDRRWLGLLVFAPILLLVPGIGDRLLDLSDGNTADAYATLNSFAWRQILWANTLDWLWRNPPGLFGHGLDHYPVFVPLFFDVQGRPSDAIGTHNALLQIWFEIGIAGIASFAFAIAALGFTLLRRCASDFAGSALAIALTVAFLACAYSDNVLDYLQFQWPFWFFLGTVSATASFLRVERLASQRARHFNRPLVPTRQGSLA
jgi:O-antigen ligase